MPMSDGRLECLQHFNGDFAFALWDGIKQRLWLVRDRVGVKPLYYTFAEGSIIFASEIKALLVHPDVHCKVNETAVFDYLSFLTTPAPETMFSGIFKLPSATWMIIDQKGAIQKGVTGIHLILKCDCPA